MKPTIFLPETIAAAGLNLLLDSCHCVAPWNEGKKLAGAELNRLLNDADGVLVRLFRVDALQLENAPRLKVIAKHGVGVDNIDVAAATARRIPVVFTPNANANAVAEHTMTLMLSLARNLFPAGVAMRDGRFAERDKFTGIELSGKTLGVLGLGRIGRRVAEMASRGFAMDVLAYDPFIVKGDYTGPAAVVTLEEVLRGADFLTLHLPLTTQTHHFIDSRLLANLRPGCHIINTSRGGVIDELALASALNAGRIAGAALDVFETEPLPANHPFWDAPNLLLTPHISSSSSESLERMAVDAAQGLLDVLQGHKPRYIVNPEVLA